MAPRGIPACKRQQYEECLAQRQRQDRMRQRRRDGAGHELGRLQTRLPWPVAPATVGVGLDAGPEVEETCA